MSGSSDHSEPDLTPMLDMVFQLITFFMLVMNVKSAALDISLKLPVVGSARPVDTKGQEDLLILNINSLGELTVYGAKKDIESYLAGEAEVTRMRARAKGDVLNAGDELPGTVVIRADVSARFTMLYKVISTCQKHGFRKFALKAVDREKT